MYVKICGITKLDQAQTITTLGADCLGFIAVKSSPRFVSPIAVAAITNNIHKNGHRIDYAGVFFDADLDLISTYILAADLNFIQLHGHESPEFCLKLKLKFPHLQLIKAFRIKDRQSLDQILAYSNCVDVMLLDAYDPQLAGGTGKTIDWELLANFSQNHLPCKWWLAGGLSPQNVEAAIARLRPDGIDVSSGVEISAGDKDIEQVKKLLHLAKAIKF